MSTPWTEVKPDKSKGKSRWTRTIALDGVLFVQSVEWDKDMKMWLTKVDEGDVGDEGFKSAQEGMQYFNNKAKRGSVGL